MTTAEKPAGPSTRPVLVGGEVRPALVVTVGVAVLLAVAGALVVGAPAVAGVGVGTAMVVVFFGLGTLVVNAVAAVSPSASLLVALLTYTLEVVLVAVVFSALNASGALGTTVDATWAGMSVVVATVAWLLVHLVTATRSRQLLYDLPPRPVEQAPDASDAGAR